jgi:protein-disulfide isomerase
MMRLLFASAAALLLTATTLDGAAEAQRRGRAPVARTSPRAATPAPNWLQRVERTAEGGYRIGNPNAAVKLIEYGSITCGHCADFSTAANRPLRDNYIRTGRVSFEYRPYLIFPSDPGIFLLLGCQGPAGFFDTVEKLYASQAAWSGRLQAQASRIQALPPRQRMAAVVRASGVDQLFRQRGMSQQRIDACLADQAALRRLGEHHQRYESQGVDGTPTFLINGRRVDVGDWTGLEPLLRQP